MVKKGLGYGVSGGYLMPPDILLEWLAGHIAVPFGRQCKMMYQ
jgi:hypothetical protein